MANQQRPSSWFSLYSIRRPATAPPPARTPTPRPDSIRPPVPQPFRPPVAQPQQPTRPPTASAATPPPPIATAAPVPRAQPPSAPTPTPQPVSIKPPVPQQIRAATAKPTTSPPAPPLQLAPIQPPVPRQFRPLIAQPATFPPAVPPPSTATVPRAPSKPSPSPVAQKSSPPSLTAPTSSTVSNAKTQTTTVPAPPSTPFKSQPPAASVTSVLTSPTVGKPSSPVHSLKASTPSTILPISITSLVPTSPEIKSPSAASPTSATLSATVSQYSPSKSTTPHPPSIIISDRELKPKVVEPADAKTERKSVLVQGLTQKPNIVPPSYTTPSHVETKHHKLQNTAQGEKAGIPTKDKQAAMQRKYLESRKFGMRMVTLVGDNNGAVMVLNNSRKKYNYGAKPLSIQGKTSTPHSKQGNNEAETKEEAAAAGRSNINKEQSRHKTVQSETRTTTLFMNSNVQGVNNAIVFDSRLNQRDPGLHVSVPLTCEIEQHMIA